MSCGTGEDLLPFQQDALEVLKAVLVAQRLLRKKDEDQDLLRFLRARSFDVGKATAMYEAMTEWRKAVGADTIAQTFDFPERKAIKELYPQFHHKTDKFGRPIYIERVGQMQLEELFKTTSTERMLMYHIKEWEVLVDWKLPACSKISARPISQSLAIMDLKGLTMKHMNKQALQYIQHVSKVDQDYYPEYLGKLIIVNAPMSFKAIWAAIKPWLDKRTQKKIEVHGSCFVSRLLELVNKEDLPEFLGGTCSCPGGCENSDAGPWNDPRYQPYADPGKATTDCK
ncbi:hypothetical protein O6H91_17G090100 [Diphasiastrum complanatum]|uniref:Uncharacterized protein n=1 Tax=Diphasiastrum complanatum TaxID=34168 RepID=A0ACC2B8Z1_DIPCM|nr:hypothetical protein O6H91_17G090100 [Diphasiastrum complanatum]